LVDTDDQHSKSEGKRGIDKGLYAAHILAAQNFAIVDATAC
jgi:hypothetical protein